MKVKPEHYSAMREAMRTLRDAHPALTPEHYRANGIGKDTAMRHRWDFLNISTIDGQRSSAWICANLYPYANNAHIDTALRGIQAELWPT